MKIHHYLASERIDMEYQYRFFLSNKDDNNIKLHCHDYFELQFFPLQNVEIYINGKEKTYPKGTLMFIRPDDCHDILNPQIKNINYFHLAFTQSLAQTVFQFLTDAFESKDMLLGAPMPPYAVLSGIESENFVNELNFLYSIDPVDSKTRSVYIRYLLTYIFTNFFSKKHITSNMGIPGWLRHTCNEMTKTENFVAGIERMVEISGKTQEHLSRVMAKCLLTTPSAFINDQRLSHIANSLMNSEHSIQNLSFKSGFSSVSYMNVLFKRKYGVSPGDFRNEKKHLKNL